MNALGVTSIRPALCAGLAGLALLLAGCAPAQEVTLDQALAGKLVGVRYTSHGTYGDTVVAAFTSNVDQSLAITVEPGTLLQNRHSGSESLVVYRYKGELTSATDYTYRTDTAVNLAGPKASQLALLECYSVNALAAPASDDDDFVASGKADSDTLAVIRAATDDDSIEAKQIAVWAVTDDVSADELKAVQFTYASADLAAARAILERAGLNPADFTLFESNSTGA
jgi:hypothetical protein